MTKDEALKLALEALVAYGNKHRATYLLSGAWDAEITLGDATITTIKEALAQPPLPVQPVQEPINYEDWLYNPMTGKFIWDDLATAPPLPVQERNFCPRCGKRTADLTTIHTCTPPRNAA